MACLASVLTRATRRQIETLELMVGLVVILAAATTPSMVAFFSEIRRVAYERIAQASCCRAGGRRCAVVRCACRGCTAFGAAGAAKRGCAVGRDRAISPRLARRVPRRLSRPRIWWRRPRPGHRWRHRGRRHYRLAALRLLRWWLCS